MFVCLAATLKIVFRRSSALRSQGVTARKLSRAYLGKHLPGEAVDEEELGAKNFHAASCEYACCVHRRDKPAAVRLGQVRIPSTQASSTGPSPGDLDCLPRSNLPSGVDKAGSPPDTDPKQQCLPLQNTTVARLAQAHRPGPKVEVRHEEAPVVQHEELSLEEAPGVHRIHRGSVPRLSSASAMETPTAPLPLIAQAKFDTQNEERCSKPSAPRRRSRSREAEVAGRLSGTGASKSSPYLALALQGWEPPQASYQARAWRLPHHLSDFKAKHHRELG